MSLTPAGTPRARLLTVLAVVAASSLMAGESNQPPARVPTPAGSLVRTEFHGWHDAMILSNGLMEAVIVPQIGRIMQFRFAGESEGPFWENPQMAGGRPAPESGDWLNYGGDKAWPAPQSDWARIASRPWPPPTGFDGKPMEAIVDGSTVVLKSAIDPNFGIRALRRIQLASNRPVMTVTTTFEKLAGQPMEIGVWTITQAKDPAAVYAVLPQPPPADRAFVPMSERLPAGLAVENGLIGLTRDPHENCKIGARAPTLMWIGSNEVLQIDSALVSGAKYPDQGCSVEIYTNRDPLDYVELEILGPLARMNIGDKIERMTTFTLERRREKDPGAEARRVLAERTAGEPGP